MNAEMKCGYPDNETLFGNKMNLEVLIYASLWINLKKHYTKGKKPVAKEHILYDSVCMKCPKQ